MAVKKTQEEKQQRARTAFEYGWCQTDDKDGKKIRDGSNGKRVWRTADYMQEEPYASSVKTMLADLGLPHPHINQVFRGTHHDMLFIDSHGVVVRIGPTDVESLIHPAVSQPLGWIDDKVNGITATIHPGIELYEDYDRHYPDNGLVNKMKLAMYRTRLQTNDIAPRNAGIIRLRFNEEAEVPIAQILDIDNEINRSDKRYIANRARNASLESSRKNALSKPKTLQNALNTVSSFVEDAKNWKRAFQVHQPLRNLFWLAWRDADKNDGKPDPDYMAKFWERCASVTNKPERVLDRETNDTFDMVLYSPWTGKDEDRQPKRAVLLKEEIVMDSVIAKPDDWSKLPGKYRNDLAFTIKALYSNLEIAHHLSPEALQNKDIQKVFLNRIKSDIEVYAGLPLALKEDTAFATKTLNIYEQLYKKFPEKLHKDHDFNLKIVRQHSALFPDFLPEHRDNEEVVFSALKKRSYMLPHASERLNRDKDFLLDVIKKEPNIVRFLKPELHEDKDFVMAVIKADTKKHVLHLISGRSVNPVTSELIKSRDFIMEVAQLENVSIEDLADEYRNDPGFIAELIEKRPELKNDPYAVKVLEQEENSAAKGLQRAFKNKDKISADAKNSMKKNVSKDGADHNKRGKRGLGL